MEQREEKIINIIKEFDEKLPKFPDGRIDYSDSDSAPVIIVFLKHGKKILLLKRSEKGLHYRGKWSVVAGFLDEIRPIKDKILEEVQEEVGIKEEDILKISIGEPYEFQDEEIDKTWIRCPALIELKEQIKPILDWEHEEYRWIEMEELKDFDVVPGTEKGLDYVLRQ